MSDVDIERITRGNRRNTVLLCLVLALIACIFVILHNRGAWLDEQDKTIQELVETDKFLMGEVADSLKTLKQTAPKDVLANQRKQFAEMQASFDSLQSTIAEALERRGEWTEELQRRNPSLDIPGYPSE